MKYMISKELAEQAWKLLNEGKEDLIEKGYTKREFVRGNGKRKDYWRLRNFNGVSGKKNKVKITNSEKQKDAIKEKIAKKIFYP